MTETEHNVRVIEVTETALTIEVDGKRITAPWPQLSNRLKNAPQMARETIEVSPAGYGLHWPLADEDLSIDGILRDFG
jgi:hypothetical protein